MSRALGVIVGVLLSIVAIDSSADDTNYRSVPIGAHAIALGGNFTGVADDASAAYYNPAGLASAGTVGFAGGLSINAWERFTLNSAFEQPDGTVNASARSILTLPIFIGAALKFGPKDTLERRRFSLALSVVEPIFSRVGEFLTFYGDPVEFTDTYRVDSSDRAQWYGVSFAARLKLNHLVGASLYLSVRKLNHSETGLVLGGGTPVGDDSDAYVGLTTAANTESLAFKAFHFVLRFGWLWRLKPQLQVGVMLQTPGIPLKQTVNTLSQGFINDNLDPTVPVVTVPYFSDGKVGANLPLPGQLSAGLEYWPAEKVMLAFDGAMYTPTRSGSRVESSADVPHGGAFFDDDTARRFIGNVGVSGDFYITKKVLVETGFFTDLSSAIDVPENPDRYYNPQINRFGGTISLGLNVSKISLTVGSTFIYGRGPATGVVVNPGNLAVDYSRTEATARSIFLHLTGATQAAADLGDMTARGIKKHKANKNGDPEAVPAED